MAGFATRARVLVLTIGLLAMALSPALAQEGPTAETMVGALASSRRLPISKYRRCASRRPSVSRRGRIWSRSSVR